MKFCVIGLGFFGRNLSLALTRKGAEVVAVDSSEEQVNALKDDVSFAAIMDTSDPSALRKLPLRDMDAVIVAIGENFEGSIMTTAQLQELGISKIICRVTSPIHEKLLKLMNIEQLILPEAIAAERLAKSLTLQGVVNSYDLTNGYSIVEIKATSAIIGKTLQDVNFRTAYGLNLVTIKQKTSENDENPKVIGVPRPDHEFGKNDLLVMFGHDKQIRAFLKDQE